MLRLFAFLLILVAAPAAAQLDLSRAGVERLGNGLTVIVLEDRSFPIVSTQVIYKSGSRDETSGKTGLAHFLEHLAFRGTENFPQGAATSAIYDAGGEWHGYTWLDQTTYYSTMPIGQNGEGLDLLLAIEADRMAKVRFDEAAMAAEKSAVIAEMNGYANDPASVLFDALAANALLAHPYRINTIGSPNDVMGLTLADAQSYYAAHYAPGNAVLAIVGAVDPAQTMQRVRAHFGKLEPRAPARRVIAVEPMQTGPRRFELTGPVSRQYLKIAWRAPAASAPDFAAFLLLQQLAAGGSGINFRQNDWGTPAQEGAALFGAADDVTSWFIPTADPYLFMVSASLPANSPRGELEDAIETRLERLRAAPPAPAALAAAKAAVLRQLTFDLETTEDAAHQLAFFEGIGALDALIGIEQRLQSVTAAQLQMAAQAYLDPRRKTTGWYGPGEPAELRDLGPGTPQTAASRAATPFTGSATPAPLLRKLSGGLTAIVQPSPLSPTAAVTLRGGRKSVTLAGLPDELPQLIAQAAQNWPGPAAGAEPPSDDPMARLDQLIAQHSPPAPSAPSVAVISGQVDPEAALALLEDKLGELSPPSALIAAAGLRSALPEMALQRELIPLPLAQAALGYTVPAPCPASREGLAMRIVLYVLTHEYGGRLGDLAISQRGLLYYIGSEYRGDQFGGTVAITAGVDLEKIGVLEDVLRTEILRLADDPPSPAELAAARAHILGREASAAQSNPERAEYLAHTFIQTGALPDIAALSAALDAAGPQDIAEAARRFAGGTIIRIDVSPAGQGE